MQPTPVISTLLVLLTGSLAAFNPDAAVKNYNGKDFLDEKKTYFLEWSVEWNNKLLLFNITVKGLGWVGLGFSKDGTMKDADIVVAGVSPNRRPYITDMHTDCQRNLVPDKKQDYNLLSSSEIRGRTFLQISRLIDTCDDDDYPISDDLVNIIWAIGETDHLEYHHHHRGSYHIYLLDPIVHPPLSLRTLPRWRASKRLKVPPKPTTYWCSIHKAPPLNGKKHFIEFHPILENALAVKHLHHFTLYQCIAPKGVDPRPIFEPLVTYPGEECYVNNGNRIPIAMCRQQVYIWALGGKPLVLPDHVGIPFGEFADNYYMLEAHYDNPESVPGIRFEAGVEGVYTDRLRPQDASLFLVGYDLYGIYMIPPGSQDFMVPGHCSADCTRNMFPSTGVDVFAIHSHTHGSGRKLKVHHYRNGKELPWLIKDDNYDFNFQTPRPLQTERKLLPGDHLTGSCEYSNTWTNVTTFAAFGSKDEMCLFMLYITHKIPYYWCTGQVPQEQILSILEVKNVTWDIPSQERVVTSPPFLRNLRLGFVSDFLTNWTKQKRATVASMTMNNSQLVRCPATNFAQVLQQDVNRQAGKPSQRGMTVPPSVAPDKFFTARTPNVANKYNRVRTCPANPN